MSFKAFVWAWDQDVPNGDHHHVLLALANIAPTRKVRASVPYIAKQVRRSQRKVRSALGWLEEAGLITMMPRPGKVDLITLCIPPEFKVTMDDEDDDDDRELGTRGRPLTPANPLKNPCTPHAGEPLEPCEPKEAPVGASSARGSRLPEGWEPDPNIATMIGLSSAEASDQLDRFRDYWTAQPGAKGRKADWPATWRNWCRNAMERRNGRGSPATRSAPIDRGADQHSARTEAMQSGALEAFDRWGRRRIGG